MKILLESAGSGGKVNLIHCLRQDKSIKIIGTDCMDEPPCKSLFDSFYAMPRYDDQGFLKKLVDICIKEKCSYVYPLATYSLNLFSEQKDYFARHGIKLIISDPDATKIANNKLHLYQYFLDFFPKYIPRFYFVHNLESLLTAVKELGFPNKNVCVRLPISTGGAGLRIITSDLSSMLERYLKAPAISPYITLKSFLEYIEVSPSFPHLIVQEYLPGEEWDVDCLSLDNKAVVALTRRNNDMIGGTSVDCDVLKNPVLEKLSIDILNRIGLNYINQLTFMYDENSVPKLIEINPRPPLSIDASLRSGVNLPLLLCQMLSREIAIPSVSYGYKYARLYPGISWGNENSGGYRYGA